MKKPAKLASSLSLGEANPASTKAPANANASASAKKRASAFDALGAKATIVGLLDEIRDLYLEDGVPWVVGYSGGKDSTACLALVWAALAGLDPRERVKPVHVINTDTLVENPVVAAWVSGSLDAMRRRAEASEMPIHPRRLTPAVSDSFWVNLIGRGYPAPRPKFRWCTDRLKIKPSNAFIRSVVQASGEVILVLGTRKAESAARARSMSRIERGRVRERLSPNDSLPGSLVYTPLEDWTSSDVWMFLMQRPSPWGASHKELLAMYRGASEDGECPMVVDASTPSCGDSRFGCWVCTLVEKDKSMQAMIHNDEEKEWMAPLLELRDALDAPDDRHLRDFRRSNGLVQLFKDRPIPGPYTQAAREEWLRRLLLAQRQARAAGPEHARGIELISLAELQKIREIWVVDKHEMEDNLPRIYEEALGEPYPDGPLDDGATFSAEDMRLLREAVGGDPLQFELTRELLGVVRRHRLMGRRAGLYGALEKSLKRGFYKDAEDAARFAASKLELHRAAGSDP